MKRRKKDDYEERIGNAMEVLKVFTGMIARKFRVCPLCLTYEMADAVLDAEEAGLLRHWDKDGPPPEEKDLKAMLDSLLAGTKH